ncbi:MAG: adenylate/guanylate cyclase domain-containing protein, partial [Anaerolineae bacterium]
MHDSRALEQRLLPPTLSRFLSEYFGNSAWFPIANILLELLLEKTAYLHKPDIYTLLFASLFQTALLVRWEGRSGLYRLGGNLISPALYTLLEFSLEGVSFFAKPHHLAYWLFALLIGLFQMLRADLPTAQNIFFLLEEFTRTNILLVMYAIFEYLTHPQQYYSIPTFLSDSSHQLIATAIPALGISLGVARLTAARYLTQLSQTSQRLRTYSEWLLGSVFLERLLVDPNALSLQRSERAILFLDIRGFTQWSEKHDLEQVAALLNDLYRIGENICEQYQAVKFKFIADAMMAVFSRPQQAASAALALRDEINLYLNAHNLSAGIGLHTGQVIEGLLGSPDVKFYDAIGDAVNTAQRVENASRGGEILCT